MPPALLFLFNIVLAVQRISLSHINFRNFFISVKKCHWNFDRNWIESIDGFAHYGNYNNISSIP